MKYLFISDIHGSKPQLEKALNFGKKHQCDMICIAGDILNYGPRNRIPEGIDAPGIVELLNKNADQIVAVRGNCDSEVDQMLLDFPMMSDYLLIVDEGKKILITHGHIYNQEKLPKGKFDAIVYGHTHIWELKKVNNMVICNTGSITFPKNGNVPTLCTYEHNEIKTFSLETEECLLTISI